MSDDLARKTFTELKERAGKRLVTESDRVFIPDAELDEFWASLEPASVDFMIGEWIGFFLDADGNKYSNTVNGEGSLWMEEFRGEVTASMVFDGQPVHDHFKRIDDNATSNESRPSSPALCR
jgi:hypothetical protein